MMALIAKRILLRVLGGALVFSLVALTMVMSVQLQTGGGIDEGAARRDRVNADHEEISHITLDRRPECTNGNIGECLKLLKKEFVLEMDAKLRLYNQQENELWRDVKALRFELEKEERNGSKAASSSISQPPIPAIGSGNLKTTAPASHKRPKPLPHIEEVPDEGDDEDHKRLAAFVQELKDDEDMGQHLLPIKLSKADRKNSEINPAKIMMVSASDRKLRKLNWTQYDQTIEAREAYARRHGYKFKYIDISEHFEELIIRINRRWHKLPVLRKLYREHPEVEWFWWLDMPAMITNPATDLESHLLHPKALAKRALFEYPLMNAHSRYREKYLSKDGFDPDSIDMIISQDNKGLITGSFLIRRSPFMDLLLEMWDDPMLKAMELPRFDQGALQHLMLQRPDITKRMALVPQRAFAAYTSNTTDTNDSPWAGYQPGDFVAHFAGVKPGTAAYVRLWDSYMRKASDSKAEE